jgi:hypothetical protein
MSAPHTKRAKINDGGPAFPDIVTDLDYHYESETRWPNTYSHGGMTLRDYFAAAAMQGFCAAGYVDGHEALAKRAYERPTPC